jgi:hypothetical protein
MSRACWVAFLRVGRAFASSWPSAGAWLLVSACGPGVATPMPEPPAAVFDLGGVDKDPLSGVEPATGGDSKYVTGARGTVPGGATVRITNLDQTTLVFATTAELDGSFLGVAIAQPGDELRFEWVKDGVHSEPADGIVLEKPAAARTLGVRPSARFDCVTLAPGYALDLSSETSRTLTIQNDCDQSVTLANPRARLGLTDFSLSQTLPLELAANERSELSFVFTRAQDGPREDVWFVDVTLGAESVRYPITLRAE